MGHPVDVASGVQFTAWHDIEIPGCVPLVMRRFYSTGLLEGPHAALGPGWTHFFDLTLARDVSGYRLFGDDGEEVWFEDQSGLVDGGEPVFNFSHSMELRREGDRYAVYHWHDWETEVRKQMFRVRDDGPMLLDAIEAVSGHGVALRYDDGGRLAEARQTVEGRRLLFDYDERGLLAQLRFASPISEPETVARYEYDERQRLIAVYDEAGVPLRYAYDDRNRMTQEMGRAGGGYRMKYDARGRCRETGGEDGRLLRRLELDEAERRTLVTDSLDNVTTYELNEYGQVETETLPDGASRVTQFDEHGRVVSRTGLRGETTRYAYNERGDIAEVVLPSGASTKVEYNEQHQPTSITQADGGRWQLQYERGQLTAVINPLGAKTRYEYDRENLLSAIQTPADNKISVRRNKTYSELSYSDEYGLSAIYSSNARLALVALHDARGIVRQFEYDPRGLLVAVIEPDGARKRAERDPAGRITLFTDRNGAATRIQYNAYADPVEIVRPDGALYRYEWDSEGRVTQVVNPKGETAGYAYDSQDRVTESRHFDGRRETFVYEDAGRRVKRRKPDDALLEYVYDESGQLLKILDGEGELLGNVYDNLGQIVETVTPEAEVKLEYDLCGRPVAETQNGRRVEYAYHPHGYLARQHFAGSRCGPLLFECDRRGRLLSIGGAEQVYQRFEYDGSDLLLRREMGAAVETLDYDLRRRLQARRIVRVGGGEIVSRRFSYDAQSQLTKLTDAFRGDVSHAYNANEQLVRTTSSRRGTVVYEYDQNGNLLRKGAETQLIYQSGDRLTARGAVVYERDANSRIIAARAGDKVTRYVWDSFGQLVRVMHPDGSLTAFGYDGLGRRVYKDHGGKRTDFYWAGDDLLCEQTGESVTDYAISHFNPLIIWENGLIRHVSAPVISLPYELLNQDGDVVWRGVYDDWGGLIEESSEGASNRLRLPGQYYDAETGLHYSRYRYYDPAIGQFISPDPIGLLGGLNEFAYALNPINWADPLGLTCGNVGCNTYSVYVLKKNNTIVYVGITMQEELQRFRQHDQFKDFDEMVIVAENLPDRRAARDIEGSVLYHIQQGNVTTNIDPNGLQNEVRRDGGYYHSYDTDTPHTLLTATQVSHRLKKDYRSY